MAKRATKDDPIRFPFRLSKKTTLLLRRLNLTKSELKLLLAMLKNKKHRVKVKRISGTGPERGVVDLGAENYRAALKLLDKNMAFKHRYKTHVLRKKITERIDNFAPENYVEVIELTISLNSAGLSITQELRETVDNDEVYKAEKLQRY